MIVLVKRLASLKLTLLLLLLLLGAVAIAYQHSDELFRSSVYGVWLTLPLLLLSLNLIAAIVTNPSFRAQPWLLLFHLSLLAIVLLAGVGQLINLKGWAEVTLGAEFDGVLAGAEAGPLHPWHIRQQRFVNDDFVINYQPGLSRPVDRRDTLNRVRWRDADGQVQRAVIGDQVPLVLAGYRFYTTFNKGFAPLLVWRDLQGREIPGTVHLPAWPLHEFNQAIEWTLPDSDAKLWIQLEFDEQILDPEAPSVFHAPSVYRLIVRSADNERQVLHQGDELVLPQGMLSLVGLTTWMGYSVSYDPTRYWLLAACLMAIVSIMAHFFRKFSSKPWQIDTP